ncbi:MAG: hypothetical protein HY510_00860 [Acidobacteria bacterium]|nr:hypothetical protein [Acidobacteriota bacterium]
MSMEAGKKRVGRVIRLTVGWILTVAGLVLMIPLVPGPGILFLLSGITLLSAESRGVRNLLRRLREWRLMRRAMREAEKVGVNFNLDKDDDAGSGVPPPSR